MDDLACHETAGVARLIATAGAEVRYLPASRPGLDPIERMFSKLKAWLCSAATRTVAGLIEATGDTRRAVRPGDILRWFRHGGYQAVQSSDTLNEKPLAENITDGRLNPNYLIASRVASLPGEPPPPEVHPRNPFVRQYLVQREGQENLGPTPGLSPRTPVHCGPPHACGDGGPAHEVHRAFGQLQHIASSDVESGEPRGEPPVPRFTRR